MGGVYQGLGWAKPPHDDFIRDRGGAKPPPMHEYVSIFEYPGLCFQFISDVNCFQFF